MFMAHRYIGPKTFRLHPQTETKAGRADLVGKGSHFTPKCPVKFLAPVAGLGEPVAGLRAVPTGVDHKHLAAHFLRGLQLLTQPGYFQYFKLVEPSIEHHRQLGPPRCTNFFSQPTMQIWRRGGRLAARQRLDQNLGTFNRFARE